MHWDSIKFALKQPVRAERGWGRVGHALGFNKITLRLRITLRLGPGYKAKWGRVWGDWIGPSGRVGPSRVEWGRLGLSGVGEGLGMHWDSIKLL